MAVIYKPRRGRNNENNTAMFEYMQLFCLPGRVAARRRGEVKNEISGEGSFLQMLDVLRKGKLMTVKNSLQAAF